MLNRTRRRTLAIASLTAGALALTACSALSTPPPEPEVEPIAFDTDLPPTPGNVVLAFGEPASITKTGAEGEPSAIVTVLDIVEGDPSLYEEWENASEFAGTTPYYMLIQTTRASSDRTVFAVYPVSDTGETTEYVVNAIGGSNMGSSTTDCPLTLPEHDEETGTEISCIIGLAEEGETIVGGLYNGGNYSNFLATGSDPIYGTAPITWSASATPGPIEYAAEAIDFGEPASATAPGTAVSRGTAAWLPLPGDSSTVIGTSVLDVIEGDSSFFDRYPNAEEFSEYTPTFIIVQLQYPDEESASSRALPPLRPVQSDGDYSQWMTETNPFSFATQGPGLAECGLVLPAYDPDSRTFVGCITAITTDGVSIDHVVYDGEEYRAFRANDELGYFSDPVVFE